jgi:hypothetical protein
MMVHPAISTIFGVLTAISALEAQRGATQGGRAEAGGSAETLVGRRLIMF